MLRRCWRCLDLSCEHYIADNVCKDRHRGSGMMTDCEYKEKKRVLRAWRNELNSVGICVSYTYRTDECCEHLERTDDGEWACEHCGKRVGKVPLPNSCAGCGGHSVDPDCPLHGRD